ncbi:HlyD family efflux transporter periplasmic adaptor subunit [Acinetobacter vivianii]|uniref:HlyD family efflux transporter periplasmic adaptor subunit n=1 Tax=Acinetobacter vivianii TaxID=1776742 RepID=UPI001908C3C5|nr:HlyD family secretion protein [Acinetobacter vivianii]MBJ8482415.1 HlyD family secretion protein [Acinetobacter vivianii]
MPLFFTSQTTDRSTTIEAGAHVSAGQMLLQLASSENFKITSFVSEHDLHQIKKGQIVTVTGDGLNQHTLRGSIENINEHAEPNDDITEPANFAITVALDNIPANVRPNIRSGMLVTIVVVI